MPEDFAPVWKIHQNATAAKYGVSTPTVNKWLKQYESKTNEPK
jgi:transposase-like protein